MIFFNGNNNPDNVSLFIVKIFIFCIIAIPIAIFDIKFQRYRVKNKLNKKQRFAIIVLQIIISALYLYGLYKIISQITDNIQITLPGIFFPGIFFGLQYNLFTDFENILSDII